MVQWGDNEASGRQPCGMAVSRILCEEDVNVTCPMADFRFSSKAEGDQEALLYVVQIVMGGAAWLLVASIVTDRLLGELLGLSAMCAAQFPFARKTWAAHMTPRQYWTGSLMCTAVLAGLRLVTQ